MELNFKIGAIIRFELMGCATPVVKLGKVISMTPSFVTIFPQVHVHRKDDEVVKDWMVLLNPESAELDKNCTADNNIPVHIRRNLIMSWRYASPNDDSITHDLVDIIEYQPGDHCINQYKNGICYGDGADCSTIKEENSNITFYHTPVMPPDFLKCEDTDDDGEGFELGIEHSSDVDNCQMNGIF